MFKKLLNKRIVATYGSFLNTSKEYKATMRQAAYIVVLKRLVKAMKARGWI